MRLIAIAALILLALATCKSKAAPTEERYLSYLKHFEGFRLVPYNEHGNMTVGVGHNLTANKDAIKPVYTTREVVDFFRRDLYRSIDAARSGIRGFDDLPDDVQLVVVSVIWGVGPSGFMKFKNFRACLSWKAYPEAAAELYDSKWFQQVQPERANHALQILTNTH